MKHVKCIKQQIIQWCRSWCVRMLERLHEQDRFDATTVQPQDVVWALMPLSQAKLLKVPPGHRIRPFLIIQSGTNSCKSYACSSQSGKDQAYFVNKEKYHISKSTYIDVSKQWELPYENIQSHFFQLSDKDFKEVIHHTKQKTKKKQEYGIGTILKKQGSLYVIYQIEKEQLYAHLICEQHDCTKHRHYQAISILQAVYYIDFSSKILLHELENAHVCMQLNKAQISAMRNKEKEISKQLRKQVNYVEIMKDVHMKYPLGTIFYDSYQHEEVLYLFHRNQRSYGCYLDETDDINYILRRINLTEMREHYQCKDHDFLCDLLEHVAASGEMKLIVNALLQQLKAQKVKANV